MCADFYRSVRAEEHDFGCYIDGRDGSHRRICKNCGETESEPHRYDESSGQCLCGARELRISISVRENTVKYYVGLWPFGRYKSVTTYTASFLTNAMGSVKIEYSTDNKKWSTGSCYTSDAPIEKLYVRATDSRGNKAVCEYPEA